MNRNSRYFVGSKNWASCLIAICLLLSGCFEITEDITLNADGSGTFRLIINASESKESLVNYMKVGEIEGQKIPAKVEIEHNLLKAKFVLQSIQGIDQIKISKDFENFIFKVEGAFDNIEKLNLGIVQLAESFNNTEMPVPNGANFKFRQGELSRFFPYKLDTNFYDRAKTTVKYVLDTARITSIIRTDRKIKNYTNKKAKLSPSGKALMLKASLAELTKAESSLENKISY